MSQRSTITSPHAPDFAELRAWLETMLKALRFVEVVTAVIALVTRMQGLNAELVAQVSGLRRKRPRSETLERLERQLLLPFFKIVKASSAQPENDAADAKPRKASRRGKHPGRAALPAHLERVRVVNALTPEQRICPLCGSDMKTVGHSICELLDVIPAKVVVLQRLDERVACPNDDTIVSVQTPPEIVERGKLATTLIVEATCDKYIEHSPLERQCLRFQRSGVDVAPQTLGRSVAAHIDLLTPIAAAIHEQTRTPGLLATDATGLPVLDTDAPDGIRNGTIWCWTNARWVSFFYSRVGDADSVRRFLGDDLARTVQCDGTSVTNFIERAGGKRPGCWSHARRGFADAARAGDTLALEALRKIRPLFEAERKSQLAGDTAEERKARRNLYAAPALHELRAWLDQQQAIIPPKTTLGRALGYLHRQWPRLILFLDDGNIELTNNRRERELRKLVLGKKNWLFVGHDLGGARTAAILTLVATCVTHDVNPRAYLHLATKLILAGWPQKNLRELLPDRLAASHPEVVLRPRESAARGVPPN
jgi:transposase